MRQAHLLVMGQPARRYPRPNASLPREMMRWKARVSPMSIVVLEVLSVLEALLGGRRGLWTHALLAFGFQSL